MKFKELKNKTMNFIDLYIFKNFRKLKNERVIWYILLIIFIILSSFWIIVVSKENYNVRGTLILRTIIILAPVFVSLIGFNFLKISEKSQLVSRRIVSVLMITIPILILITNFYFLIDPQLADARLKDMQQQINNIDYRTRGISTDENGNTYIGGGSLILGGGAGIDPKVKENYDYLVNSLNRSDCNSAIGYFKKVEVDLKEPWRLYSDIILCYFRINNTGKAESNIKILSEKYPSAPTNHLFKANNLANKSNFSGAISEMDRGLEQVYGDETLTNYFNSVKQEIYFLKGLAEINKCAKFDFSLGSWVSWQVKNISYCYDAKSSFNESAQINIEGNLTSISLQNINLTNEVIRQYFTPSP